MSTRGTLVVAVVALLVGLCIGILGFSDVASSSENPVISGVGNIEETVIADIDARRIAELAARLDAVGPVTDDMLSKSVRAVAANAANGDVAALSVLVELARLQREHRGAPAVVERGE